MKLHAARSIAVAGLLVLTSALWADTAPDPQAIQDVLSGKRTTAHASWWGFDPNDATSSVKAAIASGAQTIILDKMPSPWIVTSIRLTSDQHLILADGVIMQAKRYEFHGKNDCLLSASGVQNVSITGYGATLRMWRQDYDAPPYEKAEWRHALSIRSCSNVRVAGLTITESGGDGIYLGVSKPGVTNANVQITDVICDRNYRQGISVISAENLLIENTTLRNTAGTAPQSGIDFEPNHASEKLVNCVMRNCLVENNAGDGFQFYLKHLTASSAPISIHLDNCRSIGDRYGFRFTVGNDPETSCVPGKVEVFNCLFEASRQSAISINQKPATKCPMIFRDCHITNSASADPGSHPILLASYPGNTEKIGGIAFIDCTVEDSHDRLPLGYTDRSGWLKLSDITGTIHVDLNGAKKRLQLTTALLDSWFPTHAFKEFPAFDTTDLSLVPAAPRTAPDQGYSCAVRQREHAEFILQPDRGDIVEFTVDLIPVGRTTVPGTSISILQPSGAELTLPQAAGQGLFRRTFTATQSGPYRIICRPGSATARIESSTHPVCLYRANLPLHLLGKSPDLYFFVPQKTSEFAVRLAAGAELESIKATLYDPSGDKIGGKDDIIAHQFLVTSPIVKDGIWRLRLDKPSHGVIEDHYIQLQGVPPLLATSPSNLLRPR